MSFGIAVRNGLGIGLLASTFLSSRVASRGAVIPLALDFTTNSYKVLGVDYSFSSLITFTRTTTATFVGSNGLIQTAAINAPRFDYDPVTLAAKGLLIEEARTNQLTYSDQFDNAAWTKTRATISANAVASPDGTVNADKLVEDTTATSSHFTNRVVTASASTAYTQSIFIKAAERTRGQLQMFGNSGGCTVDFNLTAATATAAGAYGGWASASATITNYGNGWYKITSTATTNVGLTALTWGVYLADATGNAVYTGDGVSGFFIWGAQLEANIFATSYIPTVASTVTRTVDSAIITGANFSSWYNQSEGTFVSSADTAKPSGIGSTSNIHSSNDNTTANVVSLRFVTSNLSGLVQTGGAAQTSFTGTVYAANTPIKGGIAYKLNDAALSIAGGVPVVDTLVSIGTAITQMNIGSRNANLEPLNGHIRSVSYYATRLTNAQLQALTA